MKCLSGGISDCDIRANNIQRARERGHRLEGGGQRGGWWPGAPCMEGLGQGEGRGLVYHVEKGGAPSPRILGWRPGPRRRWPSAGDAWPTPTHPCFQTDGPDLPSEQAKVRARPRSCWIPSPAATLPCPAERVHHRPGPSTAQRAARRVPPLAPRDTDATRLGHVGSESREGLGVTG